MAELLGALAPGSYLTLSHGTTDFGTEQEEAYAQEIIGKGLADVFPRTREQIATFFGDLTLIDPGIVPVSEWRPVPGAHLPTPHDVAIYGGVAQKSSRAPG
ncbi:SAM-dependent methyltransferase [Actinoplanes sp. HUAS TT8]|uniref:SAM-dependent methyltransferase n=1 Tax=Actinoplanes sp. HUAS TT8 TaxID=3447453 RepID=UPI003F528E90